MIIKKLTMNLKDLKIDSSWSLFLDRDGVINEKLPGDYVKNWGEFRFLEKVPESIQALSGIFGKVFIVTNQQGIGKGIMNERDLTELHDQMLEEVRFAGGTIHKIYFSPYRKEEKSVFRKPGIGMARKAKIDFPSIEFEKSIMVGDSISDIQFGKNAGMLTVYVSKEETLPEDIRDLVDFQYSGLNSFARDVKASAINMNQ